MSTERPYHFTYLLQVSKKSLWSLILYNFFHDLIHIYSPRAGGKQPLEDKVLMSTETSCHFGHLLLVSNHRLQQFLKNVLFYLFFIQKHKDQTWPCRIIGQGQLMVIIWTNLVVLEHPMLHTNFQGHRSFGSGEEDFLRFLPYIGVAAILVMWPGPFEQTFVPPSHGDSIWNLTLIGQAVSEEMFKECGRLMTTDGRTTETAYTISSPMSLKAQVS